MRECKQLCWWSNSFGKCIKPVHMECPLSNANRPEERVSKVYRKKPVVIEAIQWTGCNFVDVERFVGEFSQQSEFTGDLLIKTLEGIMRASAGDYIIKGVKGEFYPCKPDIFEQTYEEVQDG